MDPSLTLRNLRDDDFLDWSRAMARVFLEAFDEKGAERWRGLCPLDRLVTVTNPDGDHVGTAGSFPLSMSVPGGEPQGCAAVTAVTVRPDWRRRGVLTAMMQRLIEDAAEAGEPWAALYASEGMIYGRYGFGPAADLVQQVQFSARPVDDPLRFAVANEAAVDTVPNLPLWVRLVDLPAALMGRTYDVTDRLVLEVADGQLTSNSGTWALEVSPDGADCQATDDAPDVVLSTSHLATMVLGGYSATRLSDAGHLRGTDPSVIRRLDRQFAVARAPWSAFDF